MRQAMGKGRLLPAGRFLIADIAGMGGDSDAILQKDAFQAGDVKAWMERWFVRFFRHCDLKSRSTSD